MINDMHLLPDGEDENASGTRRLWRFQRKRHLSAQHREKDRTSSGSEA